MTETTEPTICPECAWGGGFHAPTCSRQFVLPRNVIPEKPFYAPNPDCQPDREAEYRRAWLEVAMRLFTTKNYTPEEAFDEATDFLAELKKRDNQR